LLPLAFVDARASLAFGIAIGFFAVVQLGSSVVTGIRSARSPAAHVRMDRGSLPFVIVFAGAGFGGAYLCATQVTGATIGATVPAVRWVVFALGVAVIAVGSALRLWAILTLGRWFTYDVRVTEGQQVVERGPYRWVRHPSYTGVLLVLLGLGLTFGNWLSVALVIILPTVGLVRRIRVEEAALLTTIGAPYERYSEGRARLLPGVW
jgi:protein-S-isoprenylcysteine O-methyltransferase Ste14